MIAIDSMLLVYAQWVPAKPGDVAADIVELRIRSKLLLNKYAKEDDPPIILPLVALSELLIPVSIDQHPSLIAKLSERFMLAPFDLPATAIAANLWTQARTKATVTYGSRQVLRADTMIIASAKSAGAREFYTNDENCRKLASLVMDAKELPCEDDTDMFARKDIERGDL